MGGNLRRLDLKDTSLNGFLLYSVGPNQRDDAGERNPPDKDDIAARAPN